VYEFVAESHVTESPARTGFSKSILPTFLSFFAEDIPVHGMKCGIDIMRNLEMRRLGLAIYQVCPIQITDIINPFFPRKRTEDHHICVFRGELLPYLLCEKLEQISLSSVSLMIGLFKVVPCAVKGFA
jgi:hypothetical protein